MSIYARDFRRSFVTITFFVFAKYRFFQVGRYFVTAFSNLSPSCNSFFSNSVVILCIKNNLIKEKLSQYLIPFLRYNPTHRFYGRFRIGPPVPLLRQLYKYGIFSITALNKAVRKIFVHKKLLRLRRRRRKYLG